MVRGREALSRVRVSRLCAVANIGFIGLSGVREFKRAG